MTVESFNGFCRVVEEGKVRWCMLPPGHGGIHDFFMHTYTCTCRHGVQAHRGEATSGHTWCTEIGCVCKGYTRDWAADGIQMTIVPSVH